MLGPLRPLSSRLAGSLCSCYAEEKLELVREGLKRVAGLHVATSLLREELPNRIEQSADTELTAAQRQWGHRIRFLHRNSDNGVSKNVLVHYTSNGDTLAASLAMMHAFERHAPKIGYFWPVAGSDSNRAEVMKKVFKLKDDLQGMQAMTEQEALDLLADNKLDTILDQTLSAYEKYKRKHDFVLIDGTSFTRLKQRIDTAALDAKIAAMLGAPALLVANCGRFIKRSGERARELVPPYDRLESDLVSAILVANSSFVNERVDVVGALAYRMPLPYANRETTMKLREKLKEHSVFFAGHIPDHPGLTAATVHDVQAKLSAELKHGGQVPGQLSTEVAQFVVATIQLQDLLVYLPQRLEPTQGAVVITNADRPDIVLGMISLQKSPESPNVAAVVLTGGKEIAPQIEKILEHYEPTELLPILLAKIPTFDAANALADLEGRITAETSRKIELAQVLFDENVNFSTVLNALLKDRPPRLSAKLFIFNIFQKAKANKQHIVLPEGTEPRTVQAAGEILRRGLADLTLLGPEEQILTLAKQLRVDLTDAQILDPAKAPQLEKYVDILYELRKKKGMTREYAHQQAIADVNVFGTLMIAAGDANGMVSGAIHTTANTVRPALQIVKVDPAIGLVSSIFFMCLPDRVLVYGDCAINPDPTAEELAKIAISAADSARAFDMEPRVAMLSYSTGVSGAGPQVEKVAKATQLVKEMRPDIPVEGPIQYDAAVNPETAKVKFKGKESPVAGKATVLIFPDLNTGNNTYKAVQQSTGAVAIGPMLQGLRKPVNDLSRGCTVQDIVTTVAITAIQALNAEARPKDGNQENANHEGHLTAVGA